MYQDVKNRVESADPELTVLKVVNGWMGRVEDLQKEVEAILQKGDKEIKAKCFGGRCPKNCRARYKLQKEVAQKLNQVNDLISEGNFDVVAENLARNRPYKLPVGKVVGVESELEELCSCFENNEVGIIGLYGTGGVGKTTLLKKFNNDFLRTKEGYVVIWVVASKDVDPGKLQDAIRKKLRVQDDTWNGKTEDDRATSLFNILNEKKFVLLLDDVWERIDLLKLGVPYPTNQGSKIIFTTRSEEVCNAMEAQGRIKVNFLTPDKAFELFKEKVGETILQDTRILHLARQVVDECQGLPLALCTVGRAMSNKKKSNEWERAIENLRRRPSEVQEMVEDVYHTLEFSYDTLPDDATKSCFLYCALFPEDYNIREEEIILLWIAEGFLDEFDHDIYAARKQGEEIISSLKHACLLENGEGENTTKMHDVVRDMALWVSCDHGKKTRFISRDCSGTSGLEEYNQAKWKDVERLSMWGWGEMITDLSQKLHCPNLVTLLIGSGLQVFPTEVFVLPTTIKVLDLSDNDDIRNLPSTIGDFVNIGYLNLSRTSIRKLPEDLKNLKKLRFLLLDGLDLEFLPNVISSLLSLQAFSMRYGAVPVIEENVLLNELENLNHLQDIRISINSISSLKRILISSKLQRCMCKLIVCVSPRQDNWFSSIRKMGHLETLVVRAYYTGSDDYEGADIPRSSFWGCEYTIMLRKLTLSGCDTIVDLNWLIHAPNLEFLELNNCDSLVEIITEDFGSAHTEIVKNNLFCSLTYLYLISLSKLRSICRMALQFPCLKKIEVMECPNLKKLPFNSQSALRNLLHFTGNPEWVDQLQWEDEATKHILSSKLRPFY